VSADCEVDVVAAFNKLGGFVGRLAVKVLRVNVVD
jgi:hypothetical protein